MFSFFSHQSSGKKLGMAITSWAGNKIQFFCKVFLCEASSIEVAFQNYSKTNTILFKNLNVFPLWKGYFENHRFNTIMILWKITTQSLHLIVEQNKHFILHKCYFFITQYLTWMFDYFYVFTKFSHFHFVSIIPSQIHMAML